MRSATATPAGPTLPDDELPFGRMFGIYSSIVGTSSQGHYIGPAAAAFRPQTATKTGVGRGGAVLGRWCATSAAVHSESLFGRENPICPTFLRHLYLYGTE
jgi:hypothetical protein